MLPQSVGVHMCAIYVFLGLRLIYLKKIHIKVKKIIFMFSLIYLLL